jgi:hypothetical protein
MVAPFKLRRDTTANWATANPVLEPGEMGWDTDITNMKVGDGVTAWSSLPFTQPVLEVVTPITVTTPTRILSATSNNQVFKIQTTLAAVEFTATLVNTANGLAYATLILTNNNAGPATYTGNWNGDVITVPASKTAFVRLMYVDGLGLVSFLQGITN